MKTFPKFLLHTVNRHRVKASRPTLTPWWRYSASGIDVKLGDNNKETVLNQWAKFQNFAPIGSMGWHTLLVLSIIIIIIKLTKTIGATAAWPLIIIKWTIPKGDTAALLLLGPKNVLHYWICISGEKNNPNQTSLYCTCVCVTLVTLTLAPEFKRQNKNGRLAA